MEDSGSLLSPQSPGGDYLTFLASFDLISSGQAFVYIDRLLVIAKKKGDGKNMFVHLRNIDSSGKNAIRLLYNVIFIFLLFYI